MIQQPSIGNPTVVLHVIESFGAGSLSAVMQYVQATPELEHHVLRRVRDGEYSPDGELDFFASVQELPASNVQCLVAVRRAVRTIRPDVIHAHSSLAGMFVRASIRSSVRRRIVYTPHCFAFERLDLRRWQRRALLFAEWVMATNTHTIAGCARHEAARAQRWLTCRNVVYVPNRASVPQFQVEQKSATAQALIVGRITRQKDPSFLREIVAEASDQLPAVQFRWAGGGESEATAALKEAGVEVLGWRSRSEVLRCLSTANVYVHTALWEGFPMSLLEAVELGTPVVAREIPALADGPSNWLGSTAEELADLIGQIVSDTSGATGDKNVAEWRACLQDNTVEGQRRRLQEAYQVGETQVSV